MSTQTNEYNQPVGEPVPAWTVRQRPAAVTLLGRWCRLEPLSPDLHAKDLYAAYALAPDLRDWTYLPADPCASEMEYREYVESVTQNADPFHYAVIDCRTEKPVGTLALMRQDPVNGVIEVGWVVFSPLLKRTPISTEAHYLLMSYVFDELQYRRYEWKCDSLNAPSRKAAERLGFTFEGIFRQAIVYKGRSRDTAWFSIIDSEWPRIKRAFEIWLGEDNFDHAGVQLNSLAEVRRRIT